MRIAEMCKSSSTTPAAWLALSFSLMTALSACSSEETADDAAAQGAATAAEAPTATTSPVDMSAPGAPLLLGALEQPDRAAIRLNGELGCAFYASRGDDPLFMGAGYVGDADSIPEGMVKVDGKPMKLRMTARGGYDAMADGARFSANTVSAQIEVTGSAPLPEDPPIAGESPIYAARMTVVRDGRSITIDGLYECGP